MTDIIHTGTATDNRSFDFTLTATAFIADPAAIEDATDTFNVTLVTDPAEDAFCEFDDCDTLSSPYVAVSDFDGSYSICLSHLPTATQTFFNDFLAQIS